jgi:hypothetical protein
MARVRRLLRSPVAWIGAGVLLAGAVAGAVAFQPWRLFTDVTVTEALPPGVVAQASPGQVAAQPSVRVGELARGTFLSHEHETSGSVVVLQLADGRRVLRLENLNTSDGPDLKVWLAEAPVVEGRPGWHVFDDAGYVDLGALKGNRGDQNYEIPADVDLDRLSSVSIWCDRFDVSFGAADLTVT